MTIKLDHCRYPRLGLGAIQTPSTMMSLGRRVVPAGSGLGLSARAQLNVHGPGLTPTPVAGFRFLQVEATCASNGRGRSKRLSDNLRRHGIAVELGPVERHGPRGTGISVYFRDPDGSLLEFISYPASGPELIMPVHVFQVSGQASNHPKRHPQKPLA